MTEYVYQEYPRDLVSREGKLREFKNKESVPPGWFVRDGLKEEVNPAKAKGDEATGVKVVSVEATE
jgi:hypothetical protein